MNDPDKSFFAGAPGAAEAFDLADIECGCWSCVAEAKAQQPFPQKLYFPFIVCDLCGNKRCPRATHHDNDCTQSNDSGQAGSRYA